MKALSFFLSLIIASLFGNAQTEVTFYTNYGNFALEIYDDIKPITGGNFLDLVDSNYYDGVIFHRVIDDFMIQGGDPTGTGSGGPGYTIDDEFDSTLSNVQKTISMANAGPNTGGSQFFINLVDNTYLDFDKSPFTSAHPVFGIVTHNFEVVQDIGNVDVQIGTNRPITDVVMDSVRRGNIFTVGLMESEINGISVYPNPVQTELNINQAGPSRYQFRNSLGQTVLNGELYEGHSAIDLSTLPIGYYMLQLDHSTFKILKTD